MPNARVKAPLPLGRQSQRKEYSLASKFWLDISFHYSSGWTMHKDLDLILILFLCRASKEPQRKRMKIILNNGSNLGFPETVSQPLKKVKNSVYRKLKGK